MTPAKLFTQASSTLFTHCVIARKRGQRPTGGLAFSGTEARAMAAQFRAIGWSARIVERKQ